MSKIIILAFIVFCIVLQANSITFKDAAACINAGKDNNGSESACIGEINKDEDYECCYLHYKYEEIEFKTCTPMIVSKKELKEYKDMLKDADDVQIKCSGSYIKYTLISLLSLFVLFF